MRTGRFLTILSIVLLGLVLPAAAQRTRRPAPRPTPKPTPARPAVSPVVTAAKQQVANQLYNVNVFVDKMGPIAVAIENADKDASARRLKMEDIAANETNKRKIIAAIRGLRDGLVALETDFRTKSQLTPYLPKIQGISTLCARSEDNAIAGRFVASKDPLRQVALKLNETLAVLPGPLTAEGPSGALQNRPVPANLSQTRPVMTQNVSTARRDVSVGMTTSEVLASAWGAPSNKRVSSTPNGTTEVWTYSGNRTLYFFNGKLTRIAQ
jgi:hypothetical protein